jgi:uncharacterized membrane protein SirB2
MILAMGPASLYPYVKLLHISSVIVTGCLFLLRYTWMLQGRLEQRGRWIRTLPHYNDTVLFLSGLSLASILGQLPLQAPWLTAKLFVLLAYILLGSLALKQGRGRRQRGIAGAAAIGCYFYIIAIALSHNPLANLSLLLSRFGAD